jgi:4-diphosphocytidyl-2C-methyl-D-erythritol kinase
VALHPPALGRRATCSFGLDKRIPLQAGLGGGSADAAATLLALVKLWRLPVRASQLTDIAATLGADVPFFLAGGTALGLGRGDEVYPLADLPRHWIVLVIPGFGVSSADAYNWYDEERDLARGGSAREPQHVPGPWPSRAAQMINDLEAAIARHHPEIDQMKLALRRAGALAAAMSGSGSTVFGLFQRRKDAVTAVTRLSGARLARAAHRIARSRRYTRSQNRGRCDDKSVLALLVCCSPRCLRIQPASAPARSWRQQHERAIVDEFIACSRCRTSRATATDIQRNAEHRRPDAKRGIAAARVGAGAIRSSSARSARRAHAHHRVYAHYDGQPLDPKGVALGAVHRRAARQADRAGRAVIPAAAGRHAVQPRIAPLRRVGGRRQDADHRHPGRARRDPAPPACRRARTSSSRSKARKRPTR